MAKNLLAIDQRFWLIVVLALAAGLAAGSLGGVLARNYLADQITYTSEVNLNDLKAQGSDFIIRDAKNVTVNQDLKITETLDGLQPIFVRVFKALPANAGKEAQKAGYYKLNESLFMGLTITSDGWVIALAPKELKANFDYKNYVAIGGDRQIYKIDKLGNFTGLPGEPLVFHLAGAVNLPVKKIVARADLSLGQTLLAVSNLNNIWPTTISSLNKNQDVLSSDQPNARLNLAGSEDNNFKDSFVFDLNGNLAAVVTDEREIIPAFSYDYLTNQLAPGHTLARPALGVHYLDLSQIKNPALTQTKGAWLYSTASDLAVTKGSAAAIAGLKAGDVITWVNNQKIDAANDLGDLLAAYQAGDKITLTYERDGAEQEVEVILGALKQ